MGTSSSVRRRRPVVRRDRVGNRSSASLGPSLAGALFTRTQQRVLALLFGQPERSYFATEMINLAGSGRGAVQRELKRLTESGLVTVTRIGSQKHYQANVGAPVFGDLRAIVDKTLGVAPVIRTALEALRDGIVLALLYGSVAKRVDRAQSDIDILVVAKDLGLEELYATLNPAERRLGRPVRPTLLTKQEFTSRRRSGQAFLKNVLEGEHVILMGSVDAAGTAR